MTARVAAGRTLTAAGATVVLILTLLAAVPAAQATQPNSGWGTNLVTGATCSSGGQRTGGYVVAAQNFLAGAVSYSPVDGSFGPNTTSRAQSYQRARGLSPDGCVGPRTWNDMRIYVQALCPAPYVCGGAATHETRYSTTRTYWQRTNCDWGSLIRSGTPVDRGIRYNYPYSFSTTLTGARSCA